MKKGNKFITILLVILIAGSLLVSFTYKKCEGTGKTVAVIEVDGHIVREVVLDDVTAPEEWSLHGENTYNVIRIEHGRIRFLDANCPHKQCIRSGWLSKPGETAVCLPHKTSIKIIGRRGRYKGPDAISH
ncbi:MULTISPECIES: NusG domain II-containing protein [Aminobacterium]|jgi:hypothetical protein|uniref:NusG domain II-containing protein n=1 Tax=Aminobacterium TaxID=81466 RepID=UPI00257E0BD8|nr:MULTISPECIES: NusG domain II-containing protein [unclassified Aminobacterium]